ncbi:hypothetical protein B9G55_02395 [Saccharibacillus sp. O16]|nr:hypothetical protein B9G55_02395 [Saccharibacillus sp. O16]
MSFFTKWFGKKDKSEEEHEESMSAPRNRERTESSAPASEQTSAQQTAASRASDDAGTSEPPAWTHVPEQRPGTKVFARYILLRSPELELERFAQALREREPNARGGVHEGRIIVHVRDMSIVADAIGAPLPNGEVEQNAKYNVMWPNAEEAIQGYGGHIRVTVMNVEDSVEGHKFLTNVVAALLGGIPNALAVYSAPMLISPGAYLASADMLKEEGTLPINLWVFVGLYGTEQGGSSYTHGMQDFGGDELELLNTQRSPSETFELMFSIAAYSIDRRLHFQGGENIAFKEGQSLELERSPGAALSGTTMKVKGF